MATVIENRKDGQLVSFKFRACLGRDELGKQINRYTTWKAPDGLSDSKARKAADKAVAQWEIKVKEEYRLDLEKPERVKEREIIQAREAFADFINKDWFPICIDNGEHRPKTVSFYNDTRKNIVRYFDGRAIQCITSTDIQKFLIYLRTERCFAAQNIHHHYRTLKMIFDFAVKQELVLNSPMDKVDKPRLARPKVDALTPEQARQFFAALDDCPLDFRCIMQLLVTTGLRRGELTGLQWRDIDETEATTLLEILQADIDTTEEDLKKLIEMAEEKYPDSFWAHEWEYVPADELD